MKLAWVAVTVLSLSANVAMAVDRTITFWLSTQSRVPQNNGDPPPVVSNPTLTSAQLASAGKLFLWAKTSVWQDPETELAHWTNLALATVLTGDLSSPGFKDYGLTKTVPYRWSSNSDVPPSQNGQTVAQTANDSAGLGILPYYLLSFGDNTARGHDIWACGTYDAATGIEDGYYLVGELPLTGTHGTVKIGTFSNDGTAAGGWITSVGGTADTEHVFFGVGDGAVDNRPTAAWPYVSVSDLPDATITPEPTSLALLAVALALARRRF